ncbi:prephenate dehydratase [Verrucomicrobium spinosum]|uniref:prephenate dehydratase n=1 Tax=Verrucomicrobium spinosum TaxID=2736 RepID=UPI0002DFE7F7|nr:prephenate dehydratase domain-containing protein [Verrucomicrobium spinosum]
MSDVVSPPSRPRIGFLRPARLTNGYTAAARFAAHYSGRVDAMGTVFEPVAFSSHPEIIAAQARGDIDFGVIAIENTLDGIIVESVKELERLFETPRQRRTFVVWEELLPIQHFLMSQSGGLIGIDVIRSHPSALRQCSKTLQRIKDHLEIRVEQTESTGAATLEAVANPSVAAIASREALEVYSGSLRAVDLAELEHDHQLGLEQTRSLSDYSNGFTRFWILGEKKLIQRMDSANVKDVEKSLNKTCFLLSLPNETGTLYDALGVISEHKVFLSIIYPFPRVERDFEYMFFVEVEGHLQDAAIKGIHDKLNEKFPQRPDWPPSCVWLGSFPNTELLKELPEHQTLFRRRYYPDDMNWPETA